MLRAAVVTSIPQAFCSPVVCVIVSEQFKGLRMQGFEVYVTAENMDSGLSLISCQL
jgi:hypothetical protein